MNSKFLKFLKCKHWKCKGTQRSATLPRQTFFRQRRHLPDTKCDSRMPWSMYMLKIFGASASALSGLRSRACRLVRRSSPGKHRSLDFDIEKPDTDALSKQSLCVLHGTMKGLDFARKKDAKAFNEKKSPCTEGAGRAFQSHIELPNPLLEVL